MIRFTLYPSVKFVPLSWGHFIKKKSNNEMLIAIMKWITNWISFRQDLVTPSTFTNCYAHIRFCHTQLSHIAMYSSAYIFVLGKKKQVTHAFASLMLSIIKQTVIKMLHRKESFEIWSNLKLELVGLEKNNTVTFQVENGCSLHNDFRWGNKQINVNMQSPN